MKGSSLLLQAPGIVVYYVLYTVHYISEISQNED